MILEGKKLPHQGGDLVESEPADDVNLPEIPMSTSERAIQKEAKLIAEKEKGKQDRAKDRPSEEKVEPRKNSQLVEKQKVLLKTTKAPTKDLKTRVKNVPLQVNFDGVSR